MKKGSCLCGGVSFVVTGELRPADACHCVQCSKQSGHYFMIDLPNEAWTTEVRRLRAAYDHDRTSFPVEITVAGSSGLGWSSPNQSLELVVNHVREFAQKRSPFQCRLP